MWGWVHGLIQIDWIQNTKLNLDFGLQPINTLPKSDVIWDVVKWCHQLHGSLYIVTSATFLLQIYPLFVQWPSLCGMEMPWKRYLHLFLVHKIPFLTLPVISQQRVSFKSYYCCFKFFLIQKLMESEKSLGESTGQGWSHQMLASQAFEIGSPVATEQMRLFFGPQESSCYQATHHGLLRLPGSWNDNCPVGILMEFDKLLESSMHVHLQRVHSWIALIAPLPT